MHYTLFILILPLLSFVVLGLMDTRWKARTAGTVGTCVLATVALLSYFTAFSYFFGGHREGGYSAEIAMNFEWLRFTSPTEGNLGGLHIDLGILLDPISVMMLVVITTVSLMVHIYSLGYMKGEKGFERYYAFLSLFTFSMLGLVVATNIFQMYIFWELVGVSSYLLIGFYYTKPEAVAASKKAFIVTRFADLGFLIGILLLSFYTGTFDFQTLTSDNAGVFAGAAGATFMGASVLSWAMALIFIGGAGKSAMFPLHIWLPDAMEGPTPVSALIHAATMVVAGVYLVARLFPVYVVYTPEVLNGVAYVGAFTALFSAVIACVQTDIKRVLAFSTISQIGFMMVGLGVSKMGGHDGLGYMSSMFHLFTHAMFKALLFLGAGSIIHAVHSNEMSKMGGLRKYMPLTHWTFLIACLAIAGIPPFSGFFSKDEILTATLEFSPYLGIWMSLTAGLTAFYMFRLYYNIFWNRAYKIEHNHTPHESPLAMTLPLMFLAAVTCAAGFIPFGNFVTNDGQHYHSHLEMNVALASVAVALIAIGLATFMYFKENPLPEKLAKTFSGLHRAASHRFYVDEIYLFITKKIIFKRISKPVAWFDRKAIDASMNGMANFVQAKYQQVRPFQSGRVQQYAIVMIFGALILAGIIILFVR
ncbi:MAG: NADH-quinone oxidoreductase subunit L [Prevotellaceae bacterium]|jgi:NADH-quinone oxidoreductase subunit L|nr:NADH-quinone oxidoreductase subunit L [Prevotellaceae bacterium]